jgi:hypothetical protein
MQYMYIYTPNLSILSCIYTEQLCIWFFSGACITPPLGIVCLKKYFIQNYKFDAHVFSDIE